MPRVEVVWADAAGQRTVTLDLPAGATLREAARGSGFPDVLAHGGALGVYGQRRDPGEAVREGDRVELYRALPVDPREMRRRAAKRPRS